MPGDRARSELADTRFSDLRWVPETGSTNADVLALARDGAAEGIVVVADHQSAGRGRQGRSWSAPPGSSLLVSILLRPPAAVADALTMALGVAAAEAVEEVAGVAAGLKWPNDLVWPGDGSSPDRKLAGILAEADWPSGSNIAAGYRRPPPLERVVVVAGIGINVNWPPELPAELADLATACNHVTGRETDREDLLVALLTRFDVAYGELVRSGDRAALVERWRARSATLGRRVRVHRTAGDLTGTAIDVTDDGRLVVRDDAGELHTLAVGDVVHLRAEETS